MNMRFCSAGRQAGRVLSSSDFFFLSFFFHFSRFFSFSFFLSQLLTPPPHLLPRGQKKSLFRAQKPIQ